MSDAVFRSLGTDADWSDALSESEEQPVLLFKHSNACPVSGQAQEEMKEIVDAETLPVYRVVVQENRSVSDEIEETLGVRHETPQVILLHNRTAMFDTSHFDVTATNVREAISATVSQ